MKPINLIATTAFGGACTAAVFGNLEAIWLLNTTGAPELVSLVYSVILYGLIGGGIAFGAGIGLVVLFKVISSLEKFSSFAFGIGGSAAFRLEFGSITDTPHSRPPTPCRPRRGRR